MQKITSQILYNLKKDKGAYLSFGMVIVFTAIMLNLALVLVFQVDRAYDSKFEELNTATLNICIPKIQDADTLTDEIKALTGVSEIEKRDAVFLEAVVKDFRGADFTMNTMFYNKDASRRMNRLERKEERAEVQGKSIYLPLYVASFGQFQPGDDITYEIGDKKHTFVAAGTLEEMQYGNYGQGRMGAYLPERVYEEFADMYKECVVREYSIMVDNDTGITTLQQEISNLLKEKGITMLASCDRDSTKDTRTLVCHLLIVVLTAFSFVILSVSVFLCKFRISTSIEEDMTNMGILKALGYTGNMIVASMILPYLLVAAIASCTGIIASYGVLPAVAELLALQAGFTFSPVFDIKAFCCVEMILLLIVAVFTYISAKRIRKLQPIKAIRGNGEGAKQLFSGGKQNVLVFGVSFVLTILIAFAGTLFYNVIIRPDNFISTLSEEMPDIIIYPKQKEASLLSELQSDSEIKTVLKYTVGTVNIDKVPVTVFACEDFSRVSNDLCYAGENPDEKHEIALGSSFEGKYKIGEHIKIHNGEVSHLYEITGFVQSVNYQGNVCEFSTEGYELLHAEQMIPSLYVYAAKEADVEKLMEELEECHGDMISSMVNYRNMTETTQEMYAGLTSVFVMVIVALTILIALFVLYIVIKTLLVQSRRDLGIYKAIGYSNRQLTVKVIGSFLPASVFAVLVSSTLGVWYVPRMNDFIFQTIGAVKHHMEVSFGFLMLFAVMQITVNLIISIFMTRPIKKISAYTLIKED